MLWEGVGISNKPSTVSLQHYQKQPARLAGHLLLLSKFENLKVYQLLKKPLQWQQSKEKRTYQSTVQAAGTAAIGTLDCLT